MNDIVPSSTLIQTGNKPIKNFEKKEIINEPSYIQDIINNGGQNNNEIPNNIINEISNNMNTVLQKKYNEKPIKYNIFDMFWLLNEDVYNKNYIRNKNIADFIIISFNADFGNLRLSLYHLTETTFDYNIVFQQEMFPLISGTLYPSTCFKFMNDNSSDVYIGMEQLIFKTGEAWQKERPTTILRKIDENVTKLEIINKKSNEKIIYTFKNWQNKILYQCLYFTYTEGFKIRK